MFCWKIYTRMFGHENEENIWAGIMTILVRRKKNDDHSSQKEQK